MGVIDDYLNSLEGKESLDPLEVAREMHGLHNQEISTREAKIEELTGTIAERDTAIADSLSELTRQKAKNFDLAMQIPGGNPVDASRHEPDNSGITIDDLFKKDGN